MCHIVLLLPVLALPLFMFLPFGLALFYYGLILLVCAILYWLMIRDMRRSASTGVEGMVGGLATVIGNGTGGIKVAYRGEIWDADCREETAAGEMVEVTGLERMRLVVRKRSEAVAKRPNS